MTAARPPRHADELAVALLRLGSLRVALTDFTESLSSSDHLWDHVTAMTRSHALLLHDLVNLVGVDLDHLRHEVNAAAGDRRGDDWDDVVEFGRNTP